MAEHYAVMPLTDEQRAAAIQRAQSARNCMFDSSDKGQEAWAQFFHYGPSDLIALAAEVEHLRGVQASVQRLMQQLPQSDVIDGLRALFAQR